MQPHSPILLSAGGGTEPLQPKLLQAPSPSLLLHISSFPFLDTWRQSGGPSEGPGFVGTSGHHGPTRKDGGPVPEGPKAKRLRFQGSGSGLTTEMFQ